ncbi:MAG: sigma-70 family RNA polymerase sigma factor [Phycisphaerae bacterium]|nr:sigma-70 family RNA polymerase sigma factor [Phycisphaerae bacterium]
MPDVPPQPATPPLRERFAALLERHRGIVGKVAFAYASTAHDRDDLTQEIATELWRSFPRYDDRRPFSTWAYRVALNVALSYARRGRHRPKPLEREPATAPQPEADPRIERLRVVMERLRPLDRALLALHLDDRSYAEIAEILGLTETNVATKLSRLKDSLRRDVSDASSH